MTAEPVATETGRDFIRDIVAKHVEEGKYPQIHTRFPPEPNGCANCWEVYFVTDIALTPPSKRQERIDELEEVIHHTRAVARGTSSALLVADLPIHSYDDADQAVASSKRLIDAGAHAVKLDGGQACSTQIRAITAAGIPFVGHIGMLPQHVREEGGYRIKGRTAEQQKFLLDDARAVEEGGGFAVVLELIDHLVEIRAACEQFVRKLSGFPHPSHENEKAFGRAVDDSFRVARRLVDSLVTHAPPRNRETEAAKAKARSFKRFGARA